ncbi:MAG: hypothetical protein LUI08_03225 [Prevotella sp.]|nr:hypothetical protein [Prevotella sp.]
MEFNQQTIGQVDRALERTMSKFPPSEEPARLTDIHLKASQDSGELLSFDDDGAELNRAVINDWIDNKDEDFAEAVAALLRRRLHAMSKKIDGMGIVKPFSFTLEDEDGETAHELYLADDDTVILGETLMEGLSDDLDKFLDDLMKD